MPLGVIASDDFRGLQVLRVCAAAGIETPEQVAVVGVGNDELVCNLAVPPLSSVTLNAHQVGRQAAAFLCALLEGRARAHHKRFVPPSGVATRRSTEAFAIDDEVVAAAARFIHQHACEGINVKEVVKTTQVSRRLLESRFRKWFDRTPHEEILRVKTQRVKRLLIETDLPGREIARQAGFQYVESMSQAFKAATSETCGEFRRRHRNLAGPEKEEFS